ncbi:ABC transporter permease subunit [Bacillaceae bacterium SIJ1]|uniref:PhnE/PtxC family ABC transporter permease n=1 Tax=Litoribacterium kuwaitense TaxID=1398745 RepID=UPI0013ECE1BB|nr:ABC transporter permease subunit [Litoribacterium kuwaitense]NGP44524.1 ABC transporter permease subunit [Litoribacterium kuwaitense]
MAFGEPTSIEPNRGPNKSKLTIVKPFNKASFIIGMTLLVLVALTIYGFLTFDYKGVSLIEGVLLTLDNFKTMFTEPRLSSFTFTEGLYQVTITIGLAMLSTLIGAVVSLFLGLFAAQNLTSPRISNIIKVFISFIRAIPTVLWVLIFAVAAGLGSVAAVIGMTFHSVGYLIKAYSESFEEIDEGVIEALKGSGANWWQIVFQAVIPSSITYLISWTFLRFEINFGVAVAMGAAAGAGGIGFDMFMASSFYLDLHEVGAITLYILTFAVLLEIVAVRIKRHLQSN